MNILAATKNKYGGIYIHKDELPDSIEVFSDSLMISLEQWKIEGVKAIWISISPKHAHLIQIALKYGFEYHHGKALKLMMVLRLSSNEVLPLYATHTIGVGGIVLTKKEEILTIVERHDTITRANHFKFPGGMLESGEHIADGVVREVFEETGIKTEFEGLIGFRHHHGGQFGLSNIYAACLLKPLSYDIKIDKTEIGKALWMPVNDYLENSGVGLFNKQMVKTILSPTYLKSVKIEGYMNSPDEYEVYFPTKGIV